MKRIVGLSLFIGAFGPTPLLPILPNRYYSIRWLRGLRPRAPAYFSLVGKVGKSTHRGGTLSMGSLPCGPLPHDDTKGGARPPLDTPARPILALFFLGYSRGYTPPDFIKIPVDFFRAGIIPRLHILEIPPQDLSDICRPAPSHLCCQIFYFLVHLFR